MNETRLCTIELVEQFLSASAQIEFTAHGNDAQRYEVGTNQYISKERLMRSGEKLLLKSGCLVIIFN